jgi:isochorismate hydrolase
MELRLDPKSTALVLIDLQKGIVGRQPAPHSSNKVLAKCAEMHNFSIKNIFPRMGRVRSTEEILGALRPSTQQ